MDIIQFCKNSKKYTSLEIYDAIHHCPNLDIQDNTGWTALMSAARNSNTTSTPETDQMLIQAGADLDNQDVEGWTALMKAARNSNTDSTPETVQMLIDAGVWLDSQNDE